MDWPRLSSIVLKIFREVTIYFVNQWMLAEVAQVESAPTGLKLIHEP